MTKRHAGHVRRYKEEEGLIGRQFGSWLVVGPVVSSIDLGRPYSILMIGVKCSCAQATEKFVKCLDLKSGASRGCMACSGERKGQGRWLEDRELQIAKRKILEIENRGVFVVEFTPEEVRGIITSDCAYCGAPPRPIVETRNKSPKGLNGIDRVDNSGGYVHGNVVPCCMHCNRAKMDRSVEDFKDWVLRVWDHCARDFAIQSLQLQSAGGPNSPPQ